VGCMHSDVNKRLCLFLSSIRCDLFLGTVNSMVDQLSAFASEVTRVALEVGTQGILGGQAKVEGVQGTWADLTRNVNVCRLFFFLFRVRPIHHLHHAIIS
jgi:hypothetical protein